MNTAIPRLNVTRCSHSVSSSSVLRPNILSQTRRFERPKTWIVLHSPLSGAHPQRVLFKFWSRMPLKKPRNMSLSLRCGPWWLWSWLKGLGWLQLASRCLRALIGSNSEQQLDRELWWCLLVVRSFWRRRKGLHLAGLVLDNFLVILSGTRSLPPVLSDMMIQMTCLQFKSERLLLRLSFVRNLNILCTFLICK